MFVYRKVSENVEFDYCQEMGNGIPTPYEKISREEYEKLKHQWFTEYCSYNQVHNKEQLIDLFGEVVGYTEAHMDFNGEYGVAEIIGGFDKQKRAYVRIGCKHDWETIASDRFSTTVRCKKCGTVVEQQTGY